jgi:nitrogen fixation protein FixH
VAVTAIVLVAAAVLSGLPPASFVQAAGRSAPPQSVTVTGSDFATTVRVRLTVSPGTTGANRFTARVLQFDSGRPVLARRVRLEFSLTSNPAVASELDLARGAGGSWTGRGTNLSIAGQWDVTVVIQEAATAVDVQLRLRTRLQPEQLTVSRVAGQPALYTVRLARGYSIQGYLDPVQLGAGVAHFTFFAPSGGEAVVSTARAEATTPAGASQPLKLIRFSKGHFLANLHLTPGFWTFRIDATAAGGQALSGYYSQTIGR